MARFQTPSSSLWSPYLRTQTPSICTSSQTQVSHPIEASLQLTWCHHSVAPLQLCRTSSPDEALLSALTQMQALLSLHTHFHRLWEWAWDRPSCLQFAHFWNSEYERERAPDPAHSMAVVNECSLSLLIRTAVVCLQNYCSESQMWLTPRLHIVSDQLHRCLFWFRYSDKLPLCRNSQWIL